MRCFTLLALLAICSCATNAEERVEIINDPLLVSIMALSEVTDLNTLQNNIEKNLWVRVYRLPGSQENNCFPESHGICRYKYYISTSQLDDSPDINAYFIGELGEVDEYTWLSTAEVDTAIINIAVNKYTAEALSYNKSLQNIRTNYRLVLKPGSIKFTKL